MTIAFVRNPKTGSNSIVNALPKSVVNKSHAPVSEYEGCTTFAFVRDPWERAHSWWRHQNYCKVQTFRDYILERGLSETYVHGRHDMGMLILDQRNWTEGVDVLGRFENLVPEYYRICEELGIQAVKHFPHNNRSVRRETYPYRPEMWDDEMIEHMGPMFDPLGYGRPGR